MAHKREVDEHNTDVHVVMYLYTDYVLSSIYTMKKSLRHATAMTDLYASPVQLVENTHDKPTPSLRPGFLMSQCMLSHKLNRAQLLR